MGFRAGVSGFRKNPQFKDLFKGLGFMGLGVGLRVRVSGSGFPVSGFRVCFQLPQTLLGDPLVPT